MKRIISLIMILLVCLAQIPACAVSAFEVLPMPEANPESDFGVDINVNMTTIDQYLGLEDAVYRDMRMTVDPYNYAAIGGDSVLTGMIEGFELIPYPYLAPCTNMPEALGEGYTGPTLFSFDADGKPAANYEESMALMEAIFPKDQAIILMCGAGGYAGMTKQLLISLGWDENMIINAGGYWYYEGSRSVTVCEKLENGLCRFGNVPEFSIDFSCLTPVQ